MRNHLPTFVSLVLSFASLAVSEGYEGQKQSKDKPNVLLILIDDLGWKDIGASGSTYHETPHIDQLSSEGVRFTNAYSAAPVCSPSRGAIYSGKYPARTQFTTVYTGIAGPDDRLHNKSKYRGEKDQYLEALHRHAFPKGEFLMPQAMAAGDYETGFFGKWHIGECEGYYPDDRGFDVAKGYRHTKVGTATSGHWMKTFYKYGANLKDAERDAYVADVLTSECIDFITENQKKPWFTVLSHYLVHTPIEPKPEKLERFKTKPTTDQANPGYASMVESVDESVGRVLDTLKTLGLEENTLVIFTSDNGGLTPRFTSNYPLMGGKSFPFEAGMRVPFIVKWPAQIEAGTSDKRIIGMDIYPTILSAGGLPPLPEQHVDGVDLMPVLTKKGGLESLESRPIVFHFPHYTHATGPFSSIIDGEWKLIRFYNDQDGAYLLYRLAVDPGELRDLAATQPEVVKSLAGKLDRALEGMQAEMPTVNPDYTPGTKAKQYTLKQTKNLAEKERRNFEAILRQ